MGDSNTHFDADNLGESSLIGIIMSFIMQQVLPFAIHTFSAVLSGIIVATCVFYFNRWLKKLAK